jgi:hypothetical protein
LLAAQCVCLSVDTAPTSFARRFPIAELSVPIRYQSDDTAVIPLSVMQVAVASYMQGGSKIPPSVLKAFLAPGVLHVQPVDLEIIN